MAARIIFLRPKSDDGISYLEESHSSLSSRIKFRTSYHGPQDLQTLLLFISLIFSFCFSPDGQSLGTLVLFLFLNVLMLQVVPATHCSKAIKEARLVERKFCFILEASNWGGERMDLCPKATSPPLTISVQDLLKGSFRGVWMEGGLHAETAQLALTLTLKLVMRWSEQHHLDCVKCS